MPVYAPLAGFADQRRHPRALLLIVGAHAILIGAVMTARMAVPIIEHGGPILVDPIPIPPDPPPNPEAKPEKKPRADRPVSKIDTPKPIRQMPIDKGPEIDSTPTPAGPGPIAGVDPGPISIPTPTPAVVRNGPRFATPDWALRPPYPADKQRLEEEAVLKLRLTIDERGRVIAVEPVGPADRSFLEAARKHLIASWRYRPATEDGRPVASSTVITLRFELE